MNYIFTVFLTLFLFSSCSTIDKSELYGHWQNDAWEFVFNEDGTCEIGMEGKKLPGDWHYNKMGNALEIVRNKRVFLSNLTIKGIEDDKLTLEFRNLISNSTDNTLDIQVLQKIK